MIMNCNETVIERPVIRSRGTETKQQESTPIPNLEAIKAKQKATWESGDFGQIARHIEDAAEEFMARRPLKQGARVLDVACGTGNLALVAAKRGCRVSGIDIAANLLEQARARASEDGLHVEFCEADAEALPFSEGLFDLTVSMFGVMFTPRPGVATAELRRVTRTGGQIALANWTPEGFIGKMFEVFKKHLPPPPTGIPSPMGWGDDATVRERLRHGFTNVQVTRRMAVMRFPFPPAETVEFFRRFYGPTHRAFASLNDTAQTSLQQDLVELQTAWNIAKTSGSTEVAAEYLEVVAERS
jgi:ubiquinone/menaquinone biosynthesis C-methylase UbiE